MVQVNDAVYMRAFQFFADDVRGSSGSVTMTSPSLSGTTSEFTTTLQAPATVDGRVLVTDVNYSNPDIAVVVQTRDAEHDTRTTAGATINACATLAGHHKLDHACLGNRPASAQPQLRCHPAG